MPVDLIIPVLAFFGALKAHQLGIVNWVFGALFIFRFVETHEDSISTWIVTAIIGYIALYMAIPYLVGLVLQ